DGDLDLVVNNLGSPAGLYRNEANRPRVSVRLRGVPPNTEGIGATVKLFGGAVPAQSQEIIAGGRYLSGSEPIVMFAAGTGKHDMSLAVQWRNGRRSLIRNVSANRLYEIEETGAEEVPSSKSKVQSADASVVSSQLSGAGNDKLVLVATDHGPRTTDD